MHVRSIVLSPKINALIILHRKQISGYGTVNKLKTLDFDEQLKKIGYSMDRFEIGETPLRVYVITDELRD